VSPAPTRSLLLWIDCAPNAANGQAGAAIGRQASETALFVGARDAAAAEAGAHRFADVVRLTTFAATPILATPVRSTVNRRRAVLQGSSRRSLVFHGTASA
jgi:hypothetical protein